MMMPPVEACYAALKPFHATLPFAGYLDRRGEHPPISPPHSPSLFLRQKLSVLSLIAQASLGDNMWAMSCRPYAGIIDYGSTVWSLLY